MLISKSPFSRYPPWLSGPISGELERATTQPCPQATLADDRRNPSDTDARKAFRRLNCIFFMETSQDFWKRVSPRISWRARRHNSVKRLDAAVLVCPDHLP